MPLFKNPNTKENYKYNIMTHPGLAQLRREVYISTVPLVIVPAITYFSVFYGLADYIHPYERLYAGLACTASIWLVIVVIIIVKYWDDFKAVYEGRGHIPYDKTKIADLEYLRSQEYVQAERAREDRMAKDYEKEMRRAVRKNENSILKIGTNFDAGQSSDEDELAKAEEKSKEKMMSQQGEEKKEEQVEWEYYTESEEGKKRDSDDSSDISDTDDDEEQEETKQKPVHKKGRKKHKKKFKKH